MIPLDFNRREKLLKTAKNVERLGELIAHEREVVAGSSSELSDRRADTDYAIEIIRSEIRALCESDNAGPLVFPGGVCMENANRFTDIKDT